MLQDEQAVLQMILAIKESYEEAQAEAAKGKNTTSRLLFLTEQKEGVVNYLQKEIEKLRLTLIEERRPDVATTSFSTISQKEKRSRKLPDPPVFSDGKEPNIDHWLAKMRSNLLANEDHMPTDILRKAYVENRVNGDAMRHMEARLRKGAAKPFETAEEMLELLERIYGDPNRKHTAMKALRALHMGSKDFNSFWSEFQRLSSELDYSPSTLIDELTHKLSLDMKKQLAIGNLAKDCSKTSKATIHEMSVETGKE